MNNAAILCIAILSIILSGCTPNQPENTGFDINSYSDEQLDHLGITNRNHLSATSIRALQWPDLGNEWFAKAK